MTTCLLSKRVARRLLDGRLSTRAAAAAASSDLVNTRACICTLTVQPARRGCEAGASNMHARQVERMTALATSASPMAHDDTGSSPSRGLSDQKWADSFRFNNGSDKARLLTRDVNMWASSL